MLVAGDGTVVCLHRIPVAGWPFIVPTIIGDVVPARLFRNTSVEVGDTNKVQSIGDDSIPGSTVCERTSIPVHDVLTGRVRSPDFKKLDLVVPGWPIEGIPDVCIRCMAYRRNCKKGEQDGQHQKRTHTFPFLKRALIHYSSKNPTLDGYRYQPRTSAECIIQAIARISKCLRRSYKLYVCVDMLGSQ